MKKCKKFFVFILSIMMVCQVMGCEKKDTIAIQLQDMYNGETVDLCCKGIREYLNATEETEQLSILSSRAGQDMAYQPLSFSWASDGVSKKYTVYFADNEDFKDAIVYETEGTFMNKVGCFVPGTTYYWKVVGDAEGSTSQVDSFVTLDAPVRYISTLIIPNVRDIGGWQTESGKAVKYGLIYRGGRTNQNGGNDCVLEDKELFTKKLGVKTEIDLRTANSDDGNQTISVFGESVSYYKTTITGYSYIFPSFKEVTPYNANYTRVYDERTKASVNQIFDILANKESYPIYFHCNAGADRTGTLAFLINGLLGVSYEDLTKDFELTTFSDMGARWRSSVVDGKFDAAGVFQNNNDNYVAWGKMYTTMMKEYGTGDGKLSSAIENYLKSVCDVEQTTIDSVRNILLEQ